MGLAEVVLGPGLDLAQGYKALNLAGVTKLETVTGDGQASTTHVNHEHAYGHESKLNVRSGTGGDGHLLCWVVEGLPSDELIVAPSVAVGMPPSGLFTIRHFSPWP